MDGTLDFNFQQGVMGVASVQVSDAGGVGQSVVSQSNQSGGNNPSSVAYANASTPSAPPSWVH